MMLHDDIHNYYEHLMLDEIVKQDIEQLFDVDTLADFCCTVLNQLPAKYIRYEVDLAFYLPASEHEKMVENVKKAMITATELIAKREKKTITG